MQKTNTIKFDKNEWFLYITRNNSFWSSFLMSQGNFHHFPDFGINVRFPMLVIVFDGEESHFFSREPEYSKMSDQILNSCLGEKRLRQLQKIYEELGKEVLGSLKRCLKNITPKNWEKFVEDYKRYSAGLNVTAIIGRVGVGALHKKLISLGISPEKIPETNAVITYPEEHTPLFISQYDLYKLAIKRKDKKLSNKQLEWELKKWHERNHHIPVNFTSEPWTIEDVGKQFNEINSINVKVEVKKFLNDHKRRLLEADKLLKKFNDKELSALAKTIARATYLNEYRKNVFSKVSLGFRPIFQKVAEYAGLEHWRDSFFLTPTEMTEVLKGRRVNLKKKKQERSVVGVYVDKNGKIKIIPKKDVKRFAKHIRGSVDKKTLENSEIKGYSACKGVVRGVVKVITDRKDFHKLNRGDILVAVGTSVDFVPVMEKAAAFVTNEGGITSHASIVAREMNKPCIIGTKIATKVLKDGYLVEVDANTGVVKILKRAK